MRMCMCMCMRMCMCMLHVLEPGTLCVLAARAASLPCAHPALTLT